MLDVARTSLGRSAAAAAVMTIAVTPPYDVVQLDQEDWFKGCPPYEEIDPAAVGGDPAHPRAKDDLSPRAQTRTCPCQNGVRKKDFALLIKRSTDGVPRIPTSPIQMGQAASGTRCR